MCNEPQPGSPSYEQFAAQKASLLTSLTSKAHAFTDFFNSLEGVTCNFTEGAMYSFPRIQLPQKAADAAKKAGKAQDVFYCLRLLEATGKGWAKGWRGQGGGLKHDGEGEVVAQACTHVQSLPFNSTHLNPRALPSTPTLNPLGISTVPGSGFQQMPGTFHLRTTILPLEEDVPAILAAWKQFHEGFMAEYK